MCVKCVKLGKRYLQGVRECSSSTAAANGAAV